VSTLSSPLRIAVVGMDQRVKNMLQLFFNGPCKSSCLIVDNHLAEISMIDMDVAGAQSLYEEQRAQFPDHQYIVLSLNDKNIEGAHYIAKPIKASKLLEVLSQLRRVIQSQKASKNMDVQQPAKINESENLVVDSKKSTVDKTSAHRPAMRLDENNSTSYMGALHKIDLNNEKQRLAACYKPGDFLQAYVERAYQVALSENVTVSLDDSWKSIVIFPKRNKVYIDADKKQVQAVCRIPLGVFSNSSDLAISRHDNFDETGLDKYNVFPMDAFLWQISLWTAQGRYPDGLELSKAVFLRQWPNMTRLMIFPHAMRIAALMHDQPRNLIDIAKLLNIPMQYVFAFYSAAHSIGLANQAMRQVDSMVKHERPTKPKKRGLFARILGRLTST